MCVNAGTLQDTVERMKIELENSREESQRLHSIQIGKCWLRVIMIREEGLSPIVEKCLLFISIFLIIIAVNITIMVIVFVFVIISFIICLLFLSS
jgi:hypothetical protein